MAFPDFNPLKSQKNLYDVLQALYQALGDLENITVTPSGTQDVNVTNSSLGTIATNTGRLPAQGAALKAASLPVNIASDQKVPIQGSAASNAAAVDNPVMVGGKYNATVQTFDDGDIANLQTDINGRLIVTNGTLAAGEDLTNNTQGITQKPVAGAQYSPSSVQNAGSATAGNAKASAGSVLHIAATNANAAVRYLQLHNTASAPSAGATAARYWPIPAGSAAVPGLKELGISQLLQIYCSTGISWAISTTATTYTAATAAEHTLDLDYV